MQKSRLLSHSRAILVLTFLAVFPVLNTANISAEELSGKYYSAEGVDPRIAHIWIPDDVKVLRGLFVFGVTPAIDSVGHDRSRVASPRDAIRNSSFAR